MDTAAYTQVEIKLCKEFIANAKAELQRIEIGAKSPLPMMDCPEHWTYVLETAEAKLASLTESRGTHE